MKKKFLSILAWTLSISFMTGTVENMRFVYAEPVQESEQGDNNSADTIEQTMDSISDPKQSEEIKNEDNLAKEDETKTVLSEKNNKEEMEALLKTAQEELSNILKSKEVRGTVYNCDTYEINEAADPSSKVISVVASGQQIFIDGIQIVDGALWYQVHYAQDGQPLKGYILDNYLIFVDTDFNSFRNQLLQKIKAINLAEVKVQGRASLSSVTNFDDILAYFPTSYHPYLKKLHSAHPNWTFVAQNTGLDWGTVISNEMYPSRNLIDNKNIASWKSLASRDYNQRTGKWVIKSDPYWVQASTAIVKYYMDPRNFLNETGIYQFELQTFNSNYHTQAGVESILKGTFMENAKVKSGMTYAQAFMKIGKEINVSPYLLASRVRQEQGTQGSSDLISGKVPGYEGYYNYYNIEAYGQTRAEIIENGLKEAKREGWNSRYKSLYGGSKKIAKNYISQGQDTFYLQKFDVDSSFNGCYWHQYMQNLQAAESESKNVKVAYESMGVINNSYVFKIPVFKNMPSSASAKPTQKTPGRVSINKAYSTAYNKIKIKWKKASGASGYYIYQSTSPKGKYKHVKTVSGGSSTSGSVSGLKTGKTYYFKVRAYKVISGAKCFGSYSGAKSARPMPSKTSIIKRTAADYRSIKLTWKKVSGASGYKIYRSTKKTGSYKMIKTVTSGNRTSYTNKKLTTGKTYYYKIKAYRTVGSKKYYSKYSSVVSKKAVPSTPKVTSIKASSKDKIKLSWKKVTGASGYVVYRSNSKNGTYKEIKTVKNGKTVSFTDRKLNSQKRYYYRIRAYRNVNGKMIKSSYSSKKSAVTL
ncbi:hypothetical protein [Anaerosacchariphilus polymeriproducens]|uniref:Fibronectin type-III domain-containing protein n=1 Tax=Anaerosacchariphilus polymeriproducens TaxID=1812858 RepID=A0A371ARI5_9FIRM|nr:hypothetical protein [Anaerosacchariphilus polymeriproducens]RDU22154.1 hypothetical protein DWV06_16625 [Anaerosacchariphilus polymeriproducens]